MEGRATRRGIPLAIVACLGLLLHLVIESGRTSLPANAVRLSTAGDGSTRPPIVEPDEAVDLALDRLPAVEEVAPVAPLSPIATEGHLFRPTAGCSDEELLVPLLAAPREQHLRCLWDAKDFNPRRVQVPELSREQCRRALEPHLASAAEWRRVATASGMKEFGQLVDARSPDLPFVSTERYLAMLEERAPGLWKESTTSGQISFAPSIAFEFEANLFRFAGDGWFGSRLVDMRTARPAYEAMASTGLELVRSAIEFGLTFGTLTTEEADRLRSAAMAKYAQMVGD